MRASNIPILLLPALLPLSDARATSNSGHQESNPEQPASGYGSAKPDLDLFGSNTDGFRLLVRDASSADGLLKVRQAGDENGRGDKDSKRFFQYSR